jgi:hypothetical protein
MNMDVRVPHACALAAALIAATLVGGLAAATEAFAQQAFSTPEAAAEALVDGVARNDDAQIAAVLGPDYRRYIPAESTSANDRTNFLEAWSRGHRVVATGDRAMLEVGPHGWTLPIPMAKTAAGWQFDARSAPAEMRKHRIGRNELAAIEVALAYADAQEEFYEANPDRRAARHFAQRGLSSPGRRDGLYWTSLPGEPESPLGAQFADAKPGQAYHGYLYRILTAQGKDAPGGARSFVRSGLMTEGHALVAWPERYGDTGVMTFIVGRDGVVYEKNLGANTATLARGMRAYNPDSTWAKVPRSK